MKKKRELNEYLNMIISTQDIENQEVREELIRMIWATMLVDINNHYRRMSGEERIFRDAFEKFG